MKMDDIPAGEKVKIVFWIIIAVIIVIGIASGGGMF
jgi:hypothetical protein